MYWIKVYLATIPIFFALDMLWLGVVAKSLYREQIGFLLKTEFNWPAAFLFYGIFIAGILFFAVAPALETGMWTKALLLGALFGFFTYATYDLTNLATVRDWPVLITAVDLAWGTVLSALVATGSFFVARFFV
jgi:uncharacterized membrane protein